MNQFRAFLHRELDRLDRPEVDCEDLRDLVYDAQARASKLGLVEVVKACEIRAGGISPAIARRVLTACLAACPMTTEGPLTVKQAAELLNCSTKAVYRALKTLPHLRIGEGRGTIRIKPGDLEKFRREIATPIAKDYFAKLPASK